MQNSPVITAVLNSKENFAWHSMKEIVPTLTENWVASAKDGEHQVKVIDVTDSSLDSVAAQTLNARNIVIPYFSLKMHQVARALRKDLGNDARIFLNLFNQATIGCWPTHLSGLGEVLRTDDVFIGTCSFDVESMKLSFDQSRTEVIPFTLSSLKGGEPVAGNFPPMVTEGEPIPLVYIGRISVQKNIHVLLYSLKILRELDPRLNFTLDLYGGEDNFGSPNQGMKFENYGKFLMGLVERLGLKERVHFRGHVPPERLYSELNKKKHICVSTSLHADENFGLAAFRMLCLGHSAVLSLWGGHADFGQSFGDRLRLVTVRESPAGPFVNAVEFANTLRYAIKELYKKPHEPHIPHPYLKETLAQRLRMLATEKLQPGATLKRTAMAQKILGRRQELKIFDSYEDPLVQPFFRSYGMVPKPWEKVTPRYIAPWVRVGQDETVVDDPHRGRFVFKSGQAAIQKLAEYGFAFSTFPG